MLWEASKIPVKVVKEYEQDKREIPGKNRTGNQRLHLKGKNPNLYFSIKSLPKYNLVMIWVKILSY